MIHSVWKPKFTMNDGVKIITNYELVPIDKMVSEKKTGWVVRYYCDECKSCKLETTKSKVFFTGTTLTSYPDDSLYALVLEELLMSYPVIDSVVIDTIGNRITIQTDCNVSEDVDGVPIKSYLKIKNDISCQICGMKQFQDLENFYFMDGEPYFFMSQ